MKICLAIKSFQKELIQYSLKNLIDILKKENCKFSGAIFLPEKIKKFCVLTSPHVNKDSRQHLEIRINKCFIYIDVTNYTILDKILKINIPEGVFCNFDFI